MTEEELIDYYDRYPSDRADAVKKIIRERDRLRVEIAGLKRQLYPMSSPQGDPE